MSKSKFSKRRPMLPTTIFNMVKVKVMLPEDVQVISDKDNCVYFVHPLNCLNTPQVLQVHQPKDPNMQTIFSFIESENRFRHCCPVIPFLQLIGQRFASANGDQILQTVFEFMGKSSHTPVLTIEANPRWKPPLYVNAKQYKQILKRREMRQKLEDSGRLPKSRELYMYESRHKHALKRTRTKDGRFLSANSNCNLFQRKISNVRVTTQTDPVSHISIVPVTAENLDYYTLNGMKSMTGKANETYYSSFGAW